MNGMLIEVRVRQDYESFVDLMHFITICVSRRRVLMVSVMLLLIGALSFAGGLWGENLFWLLWGMALVVSAIIVMISGLKPDMVYRKTWSKAYAKNRAMLEGNATYRFYDNYVEVYFDGENAKNYTLYNYAAFSKVYEADSGFYLALPGDVFFSIPKRYLDINQIAYLSYLLANRFGQRFINQAQKKSAGIK